MDLEKKIKEYMKDDPLIVAPTESLKGVASKMSGLGKDVAVVQDSEGIVMGLVTASDLFGALRNYILGKDLLEQMPPDVRDITVQDVLGGTRTKQFMEACGLTGTDLCISLWEDDTIANAIRLMAVGGVDHILVLGTGGVVGTVSDNDLIKAFN